MGEKLEALGEKVEEKLENLEDFFDGDEVGEKDLHLAKKLIKLKKTLIRAAVIGVAFLVAIGVIMHQKDKIDKLEEQRKRSSLVDPVSPTITLDIINTELNGISELATMEYLYTNSAKYTDAKHFKDWDIPFTGKSFILQWDGVIKAGVKMEEVVARIDEYQKVITVVLPPVEILSHDPDEKSVEVLDQNNGLFNQVTVEDKVKFDADMTEEMEQRAIDNGLLEKAQENAESVIANMLYAIPGVQGTYQVQFETRAEK